MDSADLVVNRLVRAKKGSEGTRIPWRRSATRIRTRAMLLKSAYEIMSVKGVDAATIQEITDGAQVGFGTFYNYFKSKDELAASLLDCIIDDVARRIGIATMPYKISDPARVTPMAGRLFIREAASDPVWRWWTKRPDLLHERMYTNFIFYGVRDLRLAVRAGYFALDESKLESTWRLMAWMMMGGVCDIVAGTIPLESEKWIMEMVTRVAGASAQAAQLWSADPLPPFPPSNIDFTFDVSQRGPRPYLPSDDDVSPGA